MKRLVLALVLFLITPTAYSRVSVNEVPYDASGRPVAMVVDSEGNELDIGSDGSIPVSGTLTLSDGTTVYLTVSQLESLINYKGENSTGTVLTAVVGSTISYTTQSTVIGVYIDAEEDNTDNTRYRLGVGENVNTTGNKLHPGDFIYIDDFKGIIYFQSESGSQTIIINEVDE